MSEAWEHVPIEIEEEVEVVMNDLTARPELAHSEFISSVDHLREARMRHAHLLATAGIEAEEHVGNIDPDLRLDWIIESMNGRRHGNSLTIPMLGTTPEDIEILCDFSDTESRIMINIPTHGFTQLLPMPDEVERVRATFSKGNLSIDW